MAKLRRVSAISVFFPVLLCLSVLPLPERAHAQQEKGSIVAGVKVEVWDAYGRERETREIAYALSRLKEGEPFSADLLEETLAALRRTNRFRAIDADEKKTEDGVYVTLYLTPHQFVKDIRIYGAFPLLENEILGHMAFYVGDPFVPGELDRQTALLTEYLRLEGFVDPKAEARVEIDPKDGAAVVLLTLRKGAPYTLRDVGFTGNKTYTDAVLKWKMKSWRGTLLGIITGRFTEDELKSDVEHLIDFYRKNGYAEISIEHEIRREPSRQAVHVSLNIIEGPLYRTEFTGNERIPARTLRNDLVFLTEGSRYGQGLRKSVTRMSDRYRGRGYQDVSVTYTVENVDHGETGEKRIEFLVDEGSRSRVRSVSVEGNESLGSRAIKKQMQTRPTGIFRTGDFVRDRLDQDMIAVQSLYRANGFLRARAESRIIKGEEPEQVKVEVTVNEGPRTTVSSIEIAGLHSVDEREANRAIALSQGRAYKPYLLKNDTDALTALLMRKGYPHARVEGNSLMSTDEKSADVTFTVAEGPYTTMGEVFFSGNFRTKERVLLRELELKRGDPFSIPLLLEEQQNLRNMEAIGSVTFNPIGLNERWDHVHLFVDVEERKSLFIDAGGGYETEKGAYMNMVIGDQNILGRNTYGWLGGNVGQTGYRGEMGIITPRLFGTRVRTNTLLYGERREEPNQTFATTTLGASVGFGWNRVRRLTTGVSFQVERKELIPLDGALDTAGVTAPRSILTASPFISYDGRDSFLYPKKGLYSILSADISKGVLNSLDDFVKLRIEQRVYSTVLDPVTLALAARYGQVVPYGAVGIVPDDQLFFLGGTSDVRGFRENLLFTDEDGNPLGGTTSLSASIEARILLRTKIGLSLFYDTGFVGDSPRSAALSDFRSSAGVGLRYRTPVGPIGLLYGANLSPKPGEDRGRLHFSIGYTF